MRAAWERSKNGTGQTKAELPDSWGKLTFIRPCLKAQIDPLRNFAAALATILTIRAIL
jgi:hypothetical protein